MNEVLSSPPFPALETGQHVCCLDGQACWRVSGRKPPAVGTQTSAQEEMRSEADPPVCVGGCWLASGRAGDTFARAQLFARPTSSCLSASTPENAEQVIRRATWVWDPSSGSFPHHTCPCTPWRPLHPQAADDKPEQTASVPGDRANGPKSPAREMEEGLLGGGRPGPGCGHSGCCAVAASERGQAGRQGERRWACARAPEEGS